ncbi:MAG: hypothetical protein A2Y95_07885 [Deltaproteobacteria bacterium RBG_13_65_10]|nr:MAG: hypothetical protein A2Y95_07885 [Deltaproteobacteria bacterium RBG_13_65_10]
MEFGLYVHIPFCASRCPYCDFTVTVTRRRPEKEYAAALVAELGARWNAGPWPDAGVRSVYFGGGTPSLVDPAMIENVLLEARRLAGPRFTPREITLEANPEGLDVHALKVWRRLGVDRLSLGAQSFKPEHLAFLGRTHRAVDIRAASQAARAAGFSNVSLDLIFGLPDQTIADLERDLEEALALGPDHLSCYSLTMEPSTAHGRAWKAKKFVLPDEEQQAEMITLIVSRLSKAGLDRYEISNFAREGYASVHNRHYWLRESYLGIGTGAHSFIASPEGGVRWWNLRDHRRYIQLALQGRSCVEQEERLSAVDARREWIFLRLRGVEGFCRREFRTLFGADPGEAFPGVLRPLVEAGLLSVRGGRIALTEEGRLLADEVFLSFF